MFVFVFVFVFRLGLAGRPFPPVIWRAEQVLLAAAQPCELPPLGVPAAEEELAHAPGLERRRDQEALTALRVLGPAVQMHAAAQHGRSELAVLAWLGSGSGSRLGLGLAPAGRGGPTGLAPRSCRGQTTKGRGRS